MRLVPPPESSICGYASAFPRRGRPGFASKVTLKVKEGAGKTGCALHPRSRVLKW